MTRVHLLVEALYVSTRGPRWRLVYACACGFEIDAGSAQTSETYTTDVRCVTCPACAVRNDEQASMKR